MRLIVLCGLALAATALTATAAPASPESRRCASEAAAKGLKGDAATEFRRTCGKGALAPKAPTGPVGRGVEARAIVAPSGADRTARSRACDAGADKRGLSGRTRKEFRLSCMATAGPVEESQTHQSAPHPAKAIPGIGVNNKSAVPPK